MAVRIQLRRGTTAQWTAANPVLAAGEPGVDLDTSVLKIGDGTTVWSGLAPATGGLNVDDYGAAGDGVTDDTLAIQAVIDVAPTGSVVALGQGKNYLVGQLTIINKTNLTFDGNQSTLTLKATGARIAAVSVEGTSSNITVENVRIVGNGVLGDAHAGLVVPSGGTIQNVRFLNNTIYNTTLGISLSGDESGTIDGALVQGNHLDNMIGTAGSYGYGIHHATSGTTASANVKIIGNSITRAQRHSIYQAKGIGVVIADNTISRHREGVATGELLSAIMIARSADVSCTGNVISQFNESGLTVGGIIDGTIARNITVNNNIFIDPLNAVPALVIGQQSSTDGFPNGVTVTGNSFFLSTSVANAIRIHTGKHITITGNTIVNDYNGTVTAIRFMGTGETAGTATYTDDVLVSGNTISMNGTGSHYAFGLTGAPETSAIGMQFIGNKITATTAFLTTASTVTNPNIYVGNQLATGASFSGTVNFAAGSLTTSGTTTTITSTALSLPTAASQLIMGDGVAAGNNSVAWQKADGNSQTFGVLRLGTATSGNRWYFQHDSGETVNFIRCNTSGTILDTPFALDYASGTAAGRSYVKVTRLAGNMGTALVTGDWALSAGFGSTASVAVGSGSTDMRGSITVTSAGTGQGANPTATLTFKDGTYGTAPFATTSRGGGSQRTVQFEAAPTTTTLVLAFLGTPIAAETYTVHYMVIK